MGRRDQMPLRDLLTEAGCTVDSLVWAHPYNADLQGLRLVQEMHSRTTPQWLDIWLLGWEGDRVWLMSLPEEGPNYDIPTVFWVPATPTARRS